MKLHKSILILLIAIFAGAQGIFSQSAEEDKVETGQLIVVIKEIQNEQAGQLIIDLYRGEENWLEPGREFAQKVLHVSKSNEMQVVFTDMPYHQEFAVQVYHDQNSNGELDFQRFPPKPKEGVGVSNNRFRLGPPYYEAAKISLKQKTTTIQINLRY